MKKILTLLICLVLFGCQRDVKKVDVKTQNYLDLLHLLSSNEKFQYEAKHFNVEFELVKNNNEFQYYVIIDKAKVAMYNISVIAMIDGMNYTKNMASNFGIFEKTNHNLIPNQSNMKRGYLEGVIVSGVSQKRDFILKILVQWSNESNTKLFQEFIILDTSVVEVKNING